MTDQVTKPASAYAILSRFNFLDFTSVTRRQVAVVCRVSRVCRELRRGAQRLCVPREQAPWQHGLELMS